MYMSVQGSFWALPDVGGAADRCLWEIGNEFKNECSDVLIWLKKRILYEEKKIWKR